MGMRYDDFERLTPAEFTACCSAWNDIREADERAKWERARTLATITIQPHIKGKMSATNLLPFPWDKKASKTTEIASQEESRERLQSKIDFI